MAIDPYPKAEREAAMKSTRRRLLIAATGLFASGIMWTGSAHEAFAQTTLLSYSAKFVCGTRTFEQAVVRGVYETSVNIHNPHFVQVKFQKKAVIAKPQRSPPGPISPFKNELLLADQARGVDCVDIRNLFVPAIPVGVFIEGFLVIYIDPRLPLDVVAVYTARERVGTSADFAQYDSKSIAVERV
ncbi:MAG: hypothetical protein ACT4SY_06565, partial [Hyphomicrobiales bacterium]